MYATKLMSIIISMLFVEACSVPMYIQSPINEEHYITPYWNKNPHKYQGKPLLKIKIQKQ